MARELYVGHLSENVTEDDVRRLFSVMGTVTSIHLIIDPDTGEFKRCGYVRMISGVDLDEVAETLDGAFLVDREIHVSIARPQKPGMSKSGGNRKPWLKPGEKPAAAGKSRPAAAGKTRPAAAGKTRPAAAAAASPAQTRTPSGGRPGAKGRPAPPAARPGRPGRKP